jgi:predicted ATP-dependent endonuclease of OLD family
MRFLKESTEKQFFLSTHSSVFLNTNYSDKVLLCTFTDSVHIGEATSQAQLLTSLGYSIADNLVSDLVVLCEGPKDRLVLEEFLKKMGVSKTNQVKIWPLGGDIMEQLDLTVLKESKKLIALVDGDPGSSHVRKNFIKNCEDLQIPVTRLGRYAIENYLSLSAISNVMHQAIPTNLTHLDPNKRVSDQLGFDVKRNNGKIAAAMDLDDIRGTDLMEFLEKVQNMLKKPSS